MDGLPPLMPRVIDMPIEGGVFPHGMGDFKMKPNADMVVELSKSFLTEASMTERKELFDRITEGYCIHCGDKEEKGSRCCCTNDE